MSTPALIINNVENMVCAKNFILDQEVPTLEQDQKSMFFSFFLYWRWKTLRSMRLYFLSIMFWMTLVSILYHYRHCVCRRPVCHNGDFCFKNSDCGGYWGAAEPWNGKCEFIPSHYKLGWVATIFCQQCFAFQIQISTTKIL